MRSRNATNCEKTIAFSTEFSFWRAVSSSTRASSSEFLALRKQRQRYLQLWCCSSISSGQCSSQYYSCVCHSSSNSCDPFPAASDQSRNALNTVDTPEPGYPGLTECIGARLRDKKPVAMRELAMLIKNQYKKSLTCLHLLRMGSSDSS